MSDNVKEILNQVVATQGLLYTKLHQYHWYVKGPQFFSLHEEYEDLYKKTAEDFDEVAERLLIIGGHPYATLKEFIDNSIIEENTANTKLGEEETVRASVKDLKAYTDLLDKAVKLTDEEGDDVSNDLLIAVKTDVDEAIWMLQAFLGNEATDQVN
ncbi:DNA protection during starvation protein [Alloiococcus otitis]|uniref:Ferritin/DPS domain-containing protein n=1 Tax=Alloiococcus otitis ATCC 51267 TaxID=883081 RepID=K9EXM2_9LACT|nr:DNA starvation/stationary phase protection protein [Alloiococcus otitis]EKU93970.1 hypothetical protein HMPREF9698_00450 [Alloiococcus otitis ATCC 51267]SUU80945.1 DNA protection during starvation protein [Alloiococcus otitis]